MAAVFWGVSFVVMKNALEHVSPLYIIAARFCGSAVLLLPFCISKLKTLDKSYVRGGVLMGAALLTAFILQTYGLMYTTPGKNAFLTTVYCIIVPFLYWAYVKKRPDRYNAAAALASLAGVGFISLDSYLRIGLGDALTIGCGFFFALHIVLTARYLEGRDPLMLALPQFASAGVLSLMGAVIFEQAPNMISTADITSVVFLTAICTAGCTLLQIIGQKYTPPSQAAVIMTFESVFGALTSIIVLHEILTLRLILGFALMFAAVIVSETKMEFIRKSCN